MTREEMALVDWLREQIEAARTALEAGKDQRTDDQVRGSIVAYRKMLAHIEKPHRRPDMQIGQPDYGFGAGPATYL